MSADRLERAAEVWIADYFLARHLVRTRDWVVRLDPAADLALRIAALTHDIERRVPGGPRLDPWRQTWDEPGYLLAHSIRSAQIVGVWLAENGAPADVCASVERLILHHEIGGYPEADLLQAADSLSFLEVNGHRPRVWVEEGRCDVASAQAKLDWARPDHGRRRAACRRALPRCGQRQAVRRSRNVCSGSAAASAILLGEWPRSR